MALPGTWAETAEVQAAAHLYDAKIRVFTADGEGNLAARFVGNPGANAGRALDLVLEHGHYRWVEGGIASDSLPREALAAQLRDVPADGNCFFWCVSSGLPAPMREHLDARRDVVDFLRRHEHMLLDGADDSLTLGLA